jgi:peptidoglycan-associated lipoprotein
MNRSVLATVIILVPALMVGCAKRPVTIATAAPAPTGVTGVSPIASTPPTAHPEIPRATARADTPTGMGARPAPSEFVAVRDLVDIHFDFDKSSIRPRDAEILDANAKWLRANEKALILIEGHCDERGTVEYNVALGDRRAKAAIDYLVAQGIAAARMTTISYGKERPKCTDHNEACWAKNRRAHFLVKRD